MGGSCFSNCYLVTDLWSVYWIKQIILSGFSIDYLYIKILALSRIVSLIFCHANAKLAPKHWTIIVIGNIANSCFRSSTVKSCVCLLSRIVPVPNDTRGLAWIICQLPHVSLLCETKKAKKKRDVSISGFTTWGVIQLSVKLSDSKIFRAELVTVTDFYAISGVGE